MPGRTGKQTPREFTNEEKSILHTAAYFHDVGKIGIPDNILLKTERLTDDEYDIMKVHPIIGANIFSMSDLFNDIVPIIKFHHERYDSKGYPDGIKGESALIQTKTNEVTIFTYPSGD